MSLAETKQLLRTFRIVPNKLLGQNFMVEPAYYEKLCQYACLGEEDVVLDAGAGFGFLTQYLADKCKAVIAVEKDSHVAAVLRGRVRDCGNVTVIEGDLLKAELPPFDKVVSIPPYYLSSRLVTWLFEHRVPCAVMIVQREFAGKLMASVGTDGYGWLAVMTVHEAEVGLFDVVPKSAFYPAPEVDSVIVRLVRWANPPFEVYDVAYFNKLLRWLFTQRNKKVCNAVSSFLRTAHGFGKEAAKQAASRCLFRDRRPRDLSPKEFGEIANALAA